MARVVTWVIRGSGGTEQSACRPGTVERERVWQVSAGCEPGRRHVSCGWRWRTSGREHLGHGRGTGNPLVNTKPPAARRLTDQPQRAVRVNRHARSMRAGLTLLLFSFFRTQYEEGVSRVAGHQGASLSHQQAQ